MKDLIQIPDFKNVRFYDMRVRLRLDSTLNEESCIELLADIIKKSSSKLQPFRSKKNQPPRSLINDPEIDYHKRIRFDISDLQTRMNKAKDIYLRWGRDTLGWAIYIFRVTTNGLSPPI